MMDICRDPRWGRVIECFGEDPYLASKMAEGAVRGYQGADPEHIRVAACAKHFAGYGFAEGGRDYDCAEISRYTMLNTRARSVPRGGEKSACGKHYDIVSGYRGHAILFR